MSLSSPTIVWFRHDLRLADNPALHAAVETGAPVILLYVLEGEAGIRALGGASKWWLDKSLRALASDIEGRGGTLTLKRGNSQAVLDRLIDETGAGAVFWNRRYDAGGRDVDRAIKTFLNDRHIEARSFNGSLLTEPWTVKTGSGSYYKVFTPYWKSVRANYSPPDPLDAPMNLAGPSVTSDPLDDWSLHPHGPDWSTGFDAVWSPGENGAAERLNRFLDGPVDRYTDERNRPDVEGGTSGLSPHLRWGEISPVQIWREVRRRLDDGRFNIVEDSAMVFLSEIVWREFSYVLLYHNPDLADENYNHEFRHMPWRDNADDYRRWCRGQTGYPIVDAGMRQLWATGWMHNRVRMIVGSFLTKHLLLPWQKGEDWFWDTLVDADPASNAASWQWVAGSGADAAPYFRVFNPITQGEKFDETGDYVRRWCPELEALPTRYLFSPWTAPEAVLNTAKVRLGDTYPKPMIDHKDGRQRALDAYDTLKAKREAA
ncbi:MAG: deoxyribodipyrimidine photo-lyase [Pseudomonadota bacterium]